MSSLHARSSISTANSNMYARPRSRSRQPIYTSDKRAKFAQRENKKYIRFVTVIAYIFCVSLPAVCLSIYYINFWDPRYIDKFTKIENPLINISNGIVNFNEDKTFSSDRMKLLKKEIPRHIREKSYANTLHLFNNFSSKENNSEKILEKVQILPTDSLEEDKQTREKYFPKEKNVPECKCTCHNDKKENNKKATILKMVLSGRKE
uniref:Uncharacterized protein n=1 Tax=Parastrongyloides trichosuri TaxID=131310 RepID=A0A0N4ZRE2_PARTI